MERALRPLVVPLEPDWCRFAGPMLLGHWGQLDSARAGFLHRYVPLHHGGGGPPWEDFPPKGLRLLGGDDDAVVVVDGLRGAD